jgi:predicted pyridoxine 5'-phosphate oxidase superfamily flavin-nucleotide-binding protein
MVIINSLTEQDPFHAGERAVQARAGVRELAERVGRSIRGVMPPVAQAFLAEQRWLVIGAVDGDARPWATILAGSPGFARAEDDRTVRISARPAPGDPLEAALTPGALVGLLVIDPSTRRRLRLNGRVTSHGASGIAIAADQVFSNCPKHIQKREADGNNIKSFDGGLAKRSTALSAPQRHWIVAADTFFIATFAPGEGADASHRGGMPGFVRVDGQRLLWPDYAGNALFNTLGNIEAYPRAGIVVPDFETGDTLHITGRAAVDWSDAHAAEIAGAQRLVTLDIEAIVELRATLPARLRLREYSPINPREA